MLKGVTFAREFGFFRIAWFSTGLAHGCHAQKLN
jgi:hypothetical protein